MKKKCERSREILLKGRKVCKTFGKGEYENKVLHEVDVDIFQGDFTVIMGSSGAGKSTLLYVLSGMDSLTEGSVVYKNQEIDKLKEEGKAKLRAEEFGFVFQQAYLVSNLTLFENVVVAGLVSGRKGDVNSRAEELFIQMHMEEAKDRLPAQVSGGEALRAAVARAVIGKPEILFADEPTGALNKSNTEEVLNLLTARNEHGQSILMVTHDIKGAIRANRILYMEDGKILDELALSPYREDRQQERTKQVSEWLSKLRW